MTALLVLALDGAAWAAVTVGAVLSAVAVVVTVFAIGARRQVERRVEALADQLDAPPAVDSGVDAALSRLHAAIDTSAFGAARRAEAVLVRALDAIPQGVVLYAPDGKQVVRNRAAAAFLDVRHGGPELDKVMWELLSPGFAG